MSYGISAGSKLSYATITGGVIGTYTDIEGCTQIPDLGQAPDNIETTTLDDTKYRKYTPGLIDLGTIDFPFNLQTPNIAANINAIAALDETAVYAWKVTYASGIEVTFKSKPRYSFNAVGVNELESFTLHLTPEDGLNTVVPQTTI